MFADNCLKTDLYELTMAAGYYQNKVDLRAVFELFCYKAPLNRSYFVACGLEQAVNYILSLRFSGQDVDFLRNQPVFRTVKPGFFEYLRNFRFSGNVWAMKEGEIFFPNEPIIQVEAPIIEAQILETYLLSIVHIQTLTATKACRVVQAANRGRKKRGVVDFGSRRAHGPEAAALAARAAYIGGCIGTSNVYAGKMFNIPVFGTMAHSWVSAFDNEEEAFLKYYEVFPENTVLLIDTYDTVKGAKKAVKLEKDINGVRLDSGDIEVLSKKVRKILNKCKLNNAKIIASGNLNEYKIEKLIKKKAPIDIFGVGTDMVTSRDLPSLDLVYKLVQIEDKDSNIKFKAKRSKGKVMIPAKKQVFRKYARNGLFAKDIIGLFSQEAPRDAQPLLTQVIKDGQLAGGLPNTATVRNYAQKRLSLLPKSCCNVHHSRYLKTVFSKELKLIWGQRPS